MTTEKVPPWPLYRLTAHQEGAVTIAGPAVPHGPYPSRAHALQAVADIASRTLRPPRPVRVEALDVDGTAWPLLAHPDGTVSEAGPPRRTGKKSKKGKPTPPRRTPAPPPPPAPAPQANAPSGPPRRGSGPSATRPPAPALPRRTEPAEADRPAPPPRCKPRPGPIHTTRVIQQHIDAGDLDIAAALAAQLDESAADAHGPSHPEALRARRLRGELAAVRGDLPGAVSILRDVAERWWHGGYRTEAERAADQAHHVWLAITELDAATRAGHSILRMRTQIPGPDASAYHQAQARQAELEAAAIRSGSETDINER
ncbi:hypothetical protein O7599_05625 [Streptomyces sp. WMMC500]|uniref:hypothetical protein n=1 Tax=Streptomyces sp. WMMC500 TaxID=3015154 RepID=UPI00248C6C88|nr:hypothetical protein [Streptomyces sp. WMMC500]WBB62020.1 hypothetical protein O7599_05625 [Streptomyces sp. WMMC500]